MGFRLPPGGGIPSSSEEVLEAFVRPLDWDVLGLEVVDWL